MSKKKPKKDPDAAALRAEVRRLRRLVEPGGGVGKLLRYSDFRRLTGLLLELDDLAAPLRAQDVEAVLRKRHHGGHDGIAVLGEHVATPGYAVGARRDAGRLGAALAKVKACADEVARIADPEKAGGPAPAIRCGARACPGKNARQRSDITYCGFCGRNLVERTPAPRTQDADTDTTETPGQDSKHGKEDGKAEANRQDEAAPVRENRARTGPSRSDEPKAKQKPAPPRDNGQAKPKQTVPDSDERSNSDKRSQLERDRAGLLKALEMAQGPAGKKP